jgi:hypothetical protein
MDQELVVREQSPPSVEIGMLQAASPKALVDGASAMARELARVVESQGLAVTLQGKKYVKCEGWTTLLAMLGCVPREVSVSHEDGVYTAVVELARIRDGVVVGRASAECGDPDETDRRGNPIWANRPKYARRSMALTRATAKACRLAFSWIMALGGYQPTPAEEMQFACLPDRQAEPDRHPSDRQGSAPPPKRQHPAKQPPLHEKLDAVSVLALQTRMEELSLDKDRVEAWCHAKWGRGIEYLSLDEASYLDDRLEGFAEKQAGENT